MEHTYSALQAWLINNIAAVLEMPPADIDVHQNLDEYGLDSMQSVCLSGDLEAWLGRQIPPTAIWDYPTIDSLCTYLLGLTGTEPVVTSFAAPVTSLGVESSDEHLNPCLVAASSAYCTAAAA